MPILHRFVVGGGRRCVVYVYSKLLNSPLETVLFADLISKFLYQSICCN